VGHLRENGFNIKTNDVSDFRLNSIKEKYGVPRALWSCHTGIVEGYVIEGHVPAELVVRLLKEKSPIAGLGVPGMPIGSPGMPGTNPQPYDVISFDGKGRMQVYQHISPRAR
jgi:hypothetical protein